jgi:hypothetical protein
MFEGELPADAFPWVFVHREDLDNQWWPQGTSAARQRGKSWRKTVYYGGEQDRNREFEIVIIVVGKEANAQLEAETERAAKEEKYTPRRLPNPIQGCAPEYVIVKKISN